MSTNPNVNINAGRLYTALQNNSVFIKNQHNDIEKVQLDYSTFVQLKELLSVLLPKEPTKPRTLYDACMQNNDFGDDDFDDIDFDKFNEKFVPEQLFQSE